MEVNLQFPGSFLKVRCVLEVIAGLLLKSQAFSVVSHLILDSLLFCFLSKLLKRKSNIHLEKSTLWLHPQLAPPLFLKSVSWSTVP